MSPLPTITSQLDVLLHLQLLKLRHTQALHRTKPAGRTGTVHREGGIITDTYTYCRSFPQSLSTSKLIHLGSSMIQEPTMFHHAQCTFAQVQRFYNILLQLETGIPSAWSMLCSCFAKNGPGWVCPHSTLTQNQLNEW